MSWPKNPSNQRELEMPKRKKTSKKVLNAIERTGLSEDVVKLLFRSGWTLQGRSPKYLKWVAPDWLPEYLKEINEIKQRMNNNG